MEKFNIFYLAEVISVEDDYRGMRIKVKSIDEGCPSDPEKYNKWVRDEVPYCFPMLPKTFQVQPQVGELVMVFMQESKQGRFGNRFYIGPIISQDYFMGHCNNNVARGILNENYYAVNAENKLVESKGNIFKPEVNPELDKKIADCEGALPNLKDVAIRSRKNSDVILKDNEIDIRCGMLKNPNRTVPNNLEYNSKDPAYIQMQYHRRKDPTLNQSINEYNSSINIVADKINLVSHISRNDFNLTKPNELINDAEMDKLLSKCHPMVFGDELASFLKDFIKAFKNHVHIYDGSSICVTQEIKNLTDERIDNMLSSSIKVN